MDGLLNDESVNQHFGMVWTSQLDLAFTMNVSGLWNGTLLVQPGTPLNEVGNLSDYFNKEERCVGDGDSQPMIAFKPTQHVTRNMNVVVGRCMKVTVGAPVNRSERMIVGETLDHLTFFFHFSLDDFIVVASESEQVLNQSSVIETDTVLQLCHNVSMLNASESRGFLVEHQHPLQTNTDLVYWANGYHLALSNQNNKTELLLTHIVEHDLDLVLCSLVTTTGVINTTFLVESGKALESISELSGFWNSSFILFNTTNSSQVYTKETLVTNDIVVTIIKSTRVVIEITPTDKVNESEVIKTISDIVGGDPSIVGVDVVRNGEGQVTEIIIIVKDENTATTIVDIINGLDTGTGCTAGVLCLKTNAYVEGETLSDAHISFASTTLLLLLSFFLINHFM